LRRCSTKQALVLHWAQMPTNKPRYTITDTGETSAMLDLAGLAWPDINDRKELLIRLAAVGKDVVSQRLTEADDGARRERQRQALESSHEFIDSEALLSDAAWR
jgi:hypothetical protein